MPKPDKPRHDTPLPDAAAYLGDLDLAGIKEAIRFRDGSMSIVVSTNEGDYHMGIEFNAPLTKAIAQHLRENGISVAQH